MVAFAKLLVWATSAHALYERTQAQLFADFNLIKSDCQSFDPRNKFYDGSNSASTVNALSQVAHDVRKAASDAKSVGALPAERCNTILSYIQSHLIPDLRNVLSYVANYQDIFASADLKTSVQSLTPVLRSEATSVCFGIAGNCPTAGRSSASAACTSVLRNLSPTTRASTPHNQRVLEARLEKADPIVGPGDLFGPSNGFCPACTTFLSLTTGATPVASVLNCVSQVDSAISKKTSEIKSVAAATSAQATAILNDLKSVVYPCLKTALNGVVTRKAQLDSSNLGPTVRSYLNNLKNDAAGLSTAVIAKVPMAQKASASQISRSFVNAIDLATTVYGVDGGGKLELRAAPPGPSGPIVTSSSCCANRIKAWSGSPSNVGAVITCIDSVENEIRSATKDITNSPQSTAAQSTVTLDYIKKTLVPCWKDILNAIIAKKAQFNSNGYGGTVRGDLNNMRSLSAGLGLALIAKTSQAQKASASAISSSIISLFNSALSKYGTS